MGLSGGGVRPGDLEPLVGALCGEPVDVSAVGEEYLVTGFVAVAAYALAARPDLGSWQQRFDQVAAQFATTCTG